MDTVSPFKMNMKKAGQLLMALKKKKLELVYSLPRANENFMLSQTLCPSWLLTGATHPQQKVEPENPRAHMNVLKTSKGPCH